MHHINVVRSRLVRCIGIVGFLLTFLVCGCVDKGDLTMGDGNHGGGVVSNAGISSDLQDYEIIQGRWHFERPGHEVYPDSIEYDDMTLTISGEEYVINKDGEDVDHGRLVNDGRYLAGESGQIYLFDHLWTSGVNGNELTIDYNIDGDWGWITLTKIPGDLDDDWSRFKRQEIRSVEVLKTDKNKRVVYEIVIDHSGSYVYMNKGHEYYKPDEGHAEQIVPAVWEILEKYQIYKFGNGDDTLDNCKDATFLRIITQSGMTIFVCRRNNKVPKELDQAACEIASLYDAYADYSEYNSHSDADITGTWRDEDGDYTYTFNSDGTYKCTPRIGQASSGTYVIVGNYIMSNDLIDGAFLAMGNRWELLGEFGDLRIADDALYGSIMVFDAEPITVKFERMN